jgi:hypothetical protein
LWDQPLKCAKFIEKFTSHDLEDSKDFNLNEFTREDLEGMIHLLHGFYSQFVRDNSELQENLNCNFIEVLEAMSLVESLFFDEYGDLCIDERSWKRVKENPHITQALLYLSANLGST